MSTRLDAQLQLSSAQAITVDAISENVYDTGPLGGSNTVRDMAANGKLAILIQVSTVFAKAGANPTLTVTVESDSAVGLDSSATVHATPMSAVAEASLVAGLVVQMPLPPGAYERYIGLRFTTNTDDFDSGAVNAWLIPASGMSTFRAYSDNSLNSA